MSTTNTVIEHFDSQVGLKACLSIPGPAATGHRWRATVGKHNPNSGALAWANPLISLFVGCTEILKQKQLLLLLLVTISNQPPAPTRTTSTTARRTLRNIYRVLKKQTNINAREKQDY